MGYSVLPLSDDIDRIYSIVDLKQFFENGCNHLNFILFGTSGIHGNYGSLKEERRFFEKHYKNKDRFITILIVQPRRASLLYGNLLLNCLDDVIYCEQLRDQSRIAVQNYFN